VVGLYVKGKTVNRQLRPSSSNYFIIFFIVNRQSSSNRQGIVNRQSSIVNRQARGPGSLMSKKVDSVQKSGHVQNIGR
jgi:hypothetical protein